MAIITVSRNIGAALVATNRGADLDTFCDYMREHVSGFIGASFPNANSNQVTFLFNSGQTTDNAAKTDLDAALAAHAAVSLVTLKAEKADEINAHRDDVLFDRFPFDNKRWDCDAASRANIIGANTLAIVSGGQLPPDFVWRDYDNQNHAATASYMAQMGAAMFSFSAAVYGASWYHKAAVASLTTAAQVRAYDFSGSWPAQD
jgi:hypothetical protein